MIAAFITLFLVGLMFGCMPFVAAFRPLPRWDSHRSAHGRTHSLRRCYIRRGAGCDWPTGFSSAAPSHFRAHRSHLRHGRRHKPSVGILGGVPKSFEKFTSCTKKPFGSFSPGAW